MTRWSPDLPLLLVTLVAGCGGRGLPAALDEAGAPATGDAGGACQCSGPNEVCRDGRCVAPTWSIVNPPTTAWLSAVWGSGPDDVWVGGDEGSVLHHDGTAWHQPSPPTTEVSVEALWGNSASELWAVGQDLVGVGGKQVIWHGDGQDWTAVATPFSDTDGTVQLFDVWSSATVRPWAVGSGAILTHDGNAWARIPNSAIPFACRGRINRAVWGAAADDVWIAGSTDALLHYDGVGLSEVPVPGAVGIQALWGSSASDIWAVGGGGLVLHYDGSTWSRHPSPTTTRLDAVWGSSAADVWAVGYGTLLHHDGQAWSAQNLLVAWAAADIWGSGPADVWIVGAKGAVLHYH